MSEELPREYWMTQQCATTLHLIKTAECPQCRIAELEATLTRVQSALSQTSQVLWKSLKAEVDRVLGPNTNSVPTGNTAVTEPCRIYEYDGAFKCCAHNRSWGAITSPQTPCPGFDEAQWYAERDERRSAANRGDAHGNDR
jgi:hypothetical protein